MPESSGFPVPRSRWVEKGDSCATCGKNFSLFTAKSNCPCCGKLCCTDCVRAECDIVTGTAPMKVCIDCFSMLQSHQRTVLEQDSSCGKSTGTSSISSLLRNCDDKRKVTLDSVNVKYLNNNESQQAVGAVGVDTVFPDARSHVEDLLKKSEYLRKENDALLKHVSEQEIQIKSLSLERDRALAEALSNEKHIHDKQERQQVLDVETRELRDQLNLCHRRIETMEKELQSAVGRAQDSEEKARKLQQRLLRWEEDKDELLLSQQSVPAVRANGNMHAVSTRFLPTSLVWDTKMAVVSPKPRGTLGPDINLRDWDFDPFDLASRVPSVLQTVAGEVALQWELFSSEDEAQKWAKLVATVENNYRPNPYHNAVHAADVLQGVFALVTAAEPLIQNMTLVERRAVAFAALTHDIRHPGRTNAFLAAVHDPVSFQFSGYGTLEKMHLATAFQLLAVPELDFTSAMDNASFLVFKNLVTRVIEITDMALHASCMTRWGAKVAGGGFDCSRAEDRLEALTLLVHAADIGGSSRGVAIAKKWLVVLDEFAEQAEEERRRGLPVTPGFDWPSSIGKSQIPFLDFFVIPIFDLIHQLFPEIEKPLRNLSALREQYATEAGVTAPFPPPVDYRSRDVKMKKMEADLAEFRSREGDFQRYLGDVKAVSSKLKRKSLDLKMKENLVNEQLRLLVGEEGRLREDLLKVEEIVLKGREIMSEPDVSFHKLMDETIGKDVDDVAHLSKLVDVNHWAKTHEQDISKREEAVEEGERSILNREKRLAMYTERLVEIAEKLCEERKHVGQAKERKLSLFHSESAVKKEKEIVGHDQRSFALTRGEAEERLAKKYNEVDELLLIVRSMRRECGARHDSQMRQQALLATLAEREAAIAEAVELARERRRQTHQGRALRPAVTQMDRLENAIYQLTAALTLLAE